MTAAQARLADTIDIFYGAADKTSEGAMAAHAYKRAVEELDTGIGREMVGSLETHVRLLVILITYNAGSAIPPNYHGAFRQDERLFSRRQ